MKKMCAIGGILMLASCGLMGVGYGDLSRTSYSISYRDNGPHLQQVEDVNRRSVNLKEVYTAFAGQTVLSDSFFSRRTYATDKLVANGNVVMSSVSAPIEFKKNDSLDIIGYVTIDGVTYSLADAGIKNYAVLVKPDGSLYKHIGKIDGGRLIMVGTDYVISNPAFRFIPTQATISENSEPLKGFDLRFDGIKLDRIWFTMMNYVSNRDGNFEEISFPNKPGIIKIDGIGIRILEADEQKLEYMVLEN